MHPFSPGQFPHLSAFFPIKYEHKEHFSKVWVGYSRILACTEVRVSQTADVKSVSPPTTSIRHDEEPGAAPGGESRLHPAGVVALRHRSRQQQRPVVVSLNRCCCCCCSLDVMMLSLSSHSKSRLVSLPQRLFLFSPFCYYYGASRCRTLQIMC